MPPSNSIVALATEDQNGRVLEVPDRALQLKTSDGVLAFCGPGPAYASAAYLDNSTGAVIVLFLAKLLALNNQWAIFLPVNEELQNAGRSRSVFVELNGVHGLIHATGSALIGPITTGGSGYLRAADAWPL
jgi:hypothetical protein